MTTLFWLALFIGGALALAYNRVPLKKSAMLTAVALLAYSIFGAGGFWWTALLWLVLLGPQLPLLFDDFRKAKITSRILKVYRKMLPSMSDTEREALEAGTVWWEGDLFSGKPDWKALLATPAAKLSAEEQAFLDGPCAELCDMINEWEITHELAEIPEPIWAHIAKHRFFGMIIPKRYGGLEFSPFAQSQIIMRVGSVSQTVSTVIAVPNSLGPGELLLKYGTEEQKDHYLPRLAEGKEIPCFGLTAPTAGSDATSIPDTGVVCKQEVNGEEVLGLRLNFNKRYITLAPVATLVGLAFKLQDPDGLLGDESKQDYGITCALIPRDTDGIEIGRRHYPLGSAWPNGPIKGEDVFVPLDTIIGGPTNAGKGWRMLVECLSVGRAVSLPAGGVGLAVHSALTAGAYARLRKQFGISIGKFEGIESALGRLGGKAYAADAARSMTLAGIAQGAKPSVAGAILKYHTTEIGREAVRDSMDIHGGKAIMLGPNNYLFRAYQEAPIGITVEGANIMTRNLIIFGQGAIRCHPWVLKEMQAAKVSDEKQCLDEFDYALFSHIGFILSNISRAFVLGLTDGRFMDVPVNGATRRYYQRFSRYSAVLATMTDTSMAVLGAKLKFKEQTSARLGDLLSYLYLGSAVLKRWEEQGRPAEDLPMVTWACEWLLLQLQTRTDELISNMPNPIVRGLLRIWTLPLGRRYRGPNDKHDHAVAQLLQEDLPARDRLQGALYREDNGINPAAKLETCFRQMLECQPLQQRIDQAIRTGLLSVDKQADPIAAALAANIINDDEAERLQQAQAQLMDIINVDDFTSDELSRLAKSATKASKQKAA